MMVCTSCMRSMLQSVRQPVIHGECKVQIALPQQHSSKAWHQASQQHTRTLGISCGNAARAAAKNLWAPAGGPTNQHTPAACVTPLQASLRCCQGQLRSPKTKTPVPGQQAAVAPTPAAGQHCTCWHAAWLHKRHKCRRAVQKEAEQHKPALQRELLNSQPAAADGAQAAQKDQSHLPLGWANTTSCAACPAASPRWSPALHTLSCCCHWSSSSPASQQPYNCGLCHVPSDVVSRGAKCVQRSKRASVPILLVSTNTSARRAWPSSTRYSLQQQADSSRQQNVFQHVFVVQPGVTHTFVLALLLLCLYHTLPTASKTPCPPCMLTLVGFSSLLLPPSRLLLCRLSSNPPEVH
jgi:hypothetical protein